MLTSSPYERLRQRQPGTRLRGQPHPHRPFHRQLGGGTSVTKLRFSRRGYLFTGVQVVSDSDSGVAFLGVELLKGVVNEMMGEVDYQKQGSMADLER